jgi:YHS domain-containing protein
MKHLFILSFLLFTSSAFSQSSSRIKHFNTENGLAVAGYDVVAYFQGKAVKGNSKYAVSYEGITYRFSSEANKSQFSKNPKMYEPQYGGWCAYAMGASGEKVEVDPDTFKILDGKLYLFYHSWVNNTLTKWEKDEIHLKSNADKSWNKLYQ